MSSKFDVPKPDKKKKKSEKELESEKMRVFRTFNHEENKSKFVTNSVKNSSYSPLTYIPMALFEQFRQFSTIYFLVVAILQSFIPLSTLSPIASVSPLVLILSLSVARKAFEDLDKRKKDLELNSLNTTRFIGGVWRSVDWKDICVGDVVKVMENEFIPADLILASCSNSEHKAFIQTSGLDGEMNLKQRLAVKDL